MLLDGASEAYELSFVAVPAQPRAGTTKSIGFTKPVPEPLEETPNENTSKNEKEIMRDTEVKERLDNAVSFLNAKF